MRDGALVMADVSYIDDKYHYVFLNPIIIEMHESNGNISISTGLLVPGTTSEEFIIQPDVILAMGPPDISFSKLYGSTVFKFFCQRILSDSEPCKEMQTMIESKRLEILSSYGMIDGGEVGELEEAPKIVYGTLH